MTDFTNALYIHPLIIIWI